jgi:predicted component of type VI protein secretion system
MPERARDSDSGSSFAASISLQLSLKGQHMGTFRFDRGPVIVGRDAQADIFIDNPGVSRQHFRIERTDAGEFRVIDLGSANGTYVNDKPVQTQTLRDGDVVQFAKYSLAVQIEELVGGTGPRRNADAPPENATVMLSPAEVRQLMADANPSAPNLKVVPGRSAAPAQASAKFESEAPAVSHGWIGYVVAAGVVLALVAAWLFMR